MATHSSILAWRIPWTEEPGGLQSMGRKESDTPELLAQQTDSLIIQLSRQTIHSMRTRAASAHFYILSTSPASAS